MNVVISRNVELCWMEAPGIHPSSLTDRRIKFRNKYRVNEATRDKIAFRMEHECNQSCREAVEGDTQRQPTGSPTKLRSEKRRKVQPDNSSRCSARLIVSVSVRRPLNAGPMYSGANQGWRGKLLADPRSRTSSSSEWCLKASLWLG